ncbi:AMP-binding protein [Microbispora sp. RL4-1S]|uniref:AMP-binding protein n=1 Tax=Microbispora oryzae TaxID=2806554 RepID=A0A940WG69_9ACTN|nr:AMP-binding protein [Microbispora oryzae]MBP2704168.1 AMP-binding protein [Microbispora oryzae]
MPPGAALFDAVRAALDGTGPAVLPLSPDLPRPALDAALDALRPTHVVTPDGMRREPDGRPTDAAVIIATSGSTGVPKGVELSAAAVTASARASLARVGARPGERWLCCLPPAHVSGLQVLVRSMLSATEPVIHARFSPADVAGSGADHVSLVPTQLRRMLDAGADVAAFRTILLGGAAAPPGLLAEARAAGARVVTTYGMSETSGGCVYDGAPLDGVEIATGDDGLVRLRGPVLFDGYRPPRGRPFEDGWLVTSDLGVIEDGRLTVLGRADDVIITGGEKVVAAAVAEVLSGHPAVRDVVVVGRPDPEWGQAVTAVVVGDVTLDELRSYAKRRLPAHAAPRAVERVARIPLLPSGKPDMVALRNQK